MQIVLSILAKPKSLLVRLSDSLYGRKLNSTQILIHFFSALFLYSLCYRVLLYSRLYMDGKEVFSFKPVYTMGFMVKFVWNELVFVTLMTASALLFVRFFRWSWKGSQSGTPRKWVFFTGLFAIHILFFVIANIYNTHYRLLFTMHTGLVYDVMVESFSAQGTGDLLQLLKWTDLVLVALPFGIFWSFLYFPKTWVTWRNRLIGSLICLTFMFHSVQLSNGQALGGELRESPVLFVIDDYLKHLINRSAPDPLKMLAQKQKNNQNNTPPPQRLAQKLPKSKGNAKDIPYTKRTGPRKKQSRSVKLVSPLFVYDIVPKKKLPPKTKHTWNVMFISLESTGFRYIFETPKGKPDAMPFLRSLAAKGWSGTRHFSPSNSSPRSLFSIFSGMYPNPQLFMFSMKRDNVLPSIFNFINQSHEPFLVTPGSLRWYFPKWFLMNSGFKEMYGYYSLYKMKQGPRGSPARNEIEVVDFALEKLKKAKEPFASIYITFAPHWPYTDYGPAYRVYKNTRRSILRYYNNLRLIDHQIKRLVDYLEKSGKMKRTILVFTGDHGEAFGQHPGNWTHSRRSYNENYHTPLIFYQPKLFKPRIINDYTSHVDILPTLLDAMHIKYNSELFQGESLFQMAQRRKYIFLYGNENTISSISRNHIKVQYSLKRRRCWLYNLKTDPLEKKRLSCKGHEQQLRALLEYRKYQTKLLWTYNRTLQREGHFHKEKHPWMD